jgi:hypothetical protein
MSLRMSRVRVLLVSCLLGCVLAGCGKEKVDFQAKFDHVVDQDWRKNWNWVDAEKFFSAGGLFVDSGEPGDPTLDRPHILPLLKRLRDKHGLKWQAVVHKKKTKFAVALVAQLPSEGDVEKIKQTIESEQDKFAGEILSQYGHQWMSVDFLTEEDLEWERQADRKEAMAAAKR